MRPLSNGNSPVPGRSQMDDVEVHYQRSIAARDRDRAGSRVQRPESGQLRPEHVTWPQRPLRVRGLQRQHRYQLQRAGNLCETPLSMPISPLATQTRYKQDSLPCVRISQTPAHVPPPSQTTTEPASFLASDALTPLPRITSAACTGSAAQKLHRQRCRLPL
jgi:hypothetical protein